MARRKDQGTPGLEVGVVLAKLGVLSGTVSVYLKRTAHLVFEMRVAYMASF